MILPRFMHHAYSKYAEVTVPLLDHWEKGWKEKFKAETLKLGIPELKLLAVIIRSAPAESALLFPRSHRSKPLSLKKDPFVKRQIDNDKSPNVYQNQVKLTYQGPSAN
jgi:hypothetical protein